jgi:hypothetical protein
MTAAVTNRDLKVNANRLDLRVEPGLDGRFRCRAE